MHDIIYYNMAKLYFRYGAMGCGKTMQLLQVAFNYEERGHQVCVIKPKTDTKNGTKLLTRIGPERETNFCFSRKTNLYNEIAKSYRNVRCVFVDEAQFLTKKQVEELWIFSKMYDKPVICYGLKTDFQTNLFEGSRRLLELADELEELTTICRCGNKAKFNARFVDGEFASEGDSIVIDGAYKNIEYKPMCGKCYIKKKYGRE